MILGHFHQNSDNSEITVSEKDSEKYAKTQQQWTEIFAFIGKHTQN